MTKKKMFNEVGSPLPGPPGGPGAPGPTAFLTRFVLTSSAVTQDVEGK